MKLHANARTCPNSRRLIVDRVCSQGWSLRKAARAAGVSERTAGKWVARFRAEGEGGLRDRSSAPKRIPHKTEAGRVQAIEALRRLRLSAAEIAELLGMALSTVSLWLKRIGLGKRSRLVPPEPTNRYQRARPGELVHIDVKKLGRILTPSHRVLGRRGRRQRRGTTAGNQRGLAGFECVHVCVDDATRLAYVEVLADERGESAAAFLDRAAGFFADRGIRVESVMTDNGSPYISAVHARRCRQLGIRHLRTRPYRPQTNGKAERFIQTLLREWAYCGRVYASSQERTSALGPWLYHYNFRRPHGSLGHRPPAARLAELIRNEVVGNYN
jgi:transposase InsO family protein